METEATNRSIGNEQTIPNKVRFLKYLQKNNILQDEETLDRRIALIPEKSRAVLENYLGLKWRALL